MPSRNLLSESSCGCRHRRLHHRLRRGAAGGDRRGKSKEPTGENLVGSFLSCACRKERGGSPVCELKHEAPLNPLVADIFSRLDFAERRGSGLGKIMDAYSLPLSNADGRLPSFTSDTFFRAILPNMTYGLTKERLVAFAEREATPNSRNHKSAVQVSRTSRPYKSAIQVTQSTLPLPKAE